MQPPYNDPTNFPPPYQAPQWNTYQPANNPKPRYSWRGRFLVLAITMVIYLIACSTPALEFNDADDPIYFGFRIVVIGWLGAFIGQFAWFANLFLLVSIFLLLFRWWISTFVSSVLALLMALQTFLLFSQKVPANEAATRYIELQSLKIGFYFWLASLLCIGIGALILRNRERPLNDSIA
jgi:hypothetical protein